MNVINNKQWSLFLGGSLLLVAIVLLFLPQLFFTPFTLFYRTTNQVLLVLGFLGSIRESKPLRVAGWTGICFFFLYAVFGSLPSVDHPDLDANGEQRPEHWIWRLVLALAFSTALVVCFSKLAVKPQSR
jgi:hypothetical protein